MLNAVRLRIAAVGGHTHTIVVDHGPDAGTSVDTGFIILNDRTYPLLMRFLTWIEVPIRKRVPTDRPQEGAGGMKEGSCPDTGCFTSSS